MRRVRVHDAADLREREEKPPVRRRVRRGIEPPFDLASVEIDEHHVLGRSDA